MPAERDKTAVGSGTNVLAPTATRMQTFLMRFFVGAGSELLKNAVLKATRAKLGKEVSVSAFLGDIVRTLMADKEGLRRALLTFGRTRPQGSLRLVKAT